MEFDDGFRGIPDAKVTPPTGTRLAELSDPARGTRPVMDEEPV